MVNRLLTFVLLAALPLPATAAMLQLPVTVTILSPSANVSPLPPSRKQPHKPQHGMALHGMPGQQISYSVGRVSGLVVLDDSGYGAISLPPSVAADAEITLNYD